MACGVLCERLTERGIFPEGVETVGEPENLFAVELLEENQVELKSKTVGTEAPSRPTSMISLQGSVV